MFTGIVEDRGRVVALEQRGPGARLVIASPVATENLRLGDSVAINGCCLTAVEFDAERIEFDVGPETLQRTNLGGLAVDDPVNLERSLRVGDELGGHLVTGHIDGPGMLETRIDDEQWSTFWFRASPELMVQMASKGSIAVDGVSLTLVDVNDERFSVMLIPHTLEVTTLGKLRHGAHVNLETDILAKYVQRQLAWKARE